MSLLCKSNLPKLYIRVVFTKSVLIVNFVYYLSQKRTHERKNKYVDKTLKSNDIFLQNKGTVRYK